MAVSEDSKTVSEAIGDGGVVVDEAPSLDALKNTPSNIARLEDVIEHCTARRKYLAQTRSSSDGGDVRWYFCKVPLADHELAASVPRTQIVGKGEYFRFGMRDSLAIEASFLQREEELLFQWWKEYAECSEGPLGRPSSSGTKQIESSPDEGQAAQSFDVDEERVGVPVKGGLYEVDLHRRHCFPVYWNGENRRVLRGHWFARKGGLDWLPLREDVAEQLEVAYRNQVWHRRRFQPSGLFAARVDLQGTNPGLHALFVGEDDTWEAWLHVDPSGFSNVIPIGGSGVKLRRGYSKSDSSKPTQDELRQQKEEERDDYCSQVPVRHLVFMVHGIGQRLEKSNLVDDVGNFRHITESLAEQHLTSHQRGTQRVLYIPCQWRKGLKLSGESAVDKITLDGVRGLRVMLSATVHDVLYYMSPIYCQDIINSVSNQLNRLYTKFLTRNPDYDGKVSIYGHSLGSVLSYDILCHQETLSSPFPMDWMYKERDSDQKSSAAVKNQSSVHDSSIKQVDERCSEIGEIVGDLGSNGDEKMDAQPSVMTHEEDDLEKNVEDESFIMSPVSSDYDELSTETLGPKQLGEEDLDELVPNYMERVPCETGALDGTTMIKSEVANDDCEKLDKEVCEDNTETMTELLLKEIESLKEKITILESKHGDKEGELQLHQENTEVPTIAVKDSPSEKLSPEECDSSKNYTPCINYTKLEFKVDTFFAVGSPLGVFLALRNIRLGMGKGDDYWAEEQVTEELPACRQMLNIFHPFDPVAYRIEPLVCKEYIGKRPVIIPYHKGGKRLHIGYQELTEKVAARSQAIKDHLYSIQVKVLTVCESRKADSQDDEDGTEQERVERSYGSLMIERLTGDAEGRIDHVLQDETFRHAYLSAIGSHTNYWRDFDTALFILKHLYKDINEDPNSPREFKVDNSKNDRGTVGWSDQRETIDEELPLTFADKRITRNFSSKVKKFLKKR